MQLEQKSCKDRRQHSEAELWNFADTIVFILCELKVLVLVLSSVVKWLQWHTLFQEKNMWKELRHSLAVVASRIEHFNLIHAEYQADELAFL